MKMTVSISKWLHGPRFCKKGVIIYSPGSAFIWKFKFIIGLGNVEKNWVKSPCVSKLSCSWSNSRSLIASIFLIENCCIFQHLTLLKEEGCQDWKVDITDILLCVFASYFSLYLSLGRL